MSLETQAVVTGVAAGRILVSPRPHSPCGNCHPDGSCRSVSLVRLFARRYPEFAVESLLPVAIGDKVIVAVPERAVLVSSMLLYVLPMFSLIAGALLGGALGGEFVSVLLAFLAFALTLFWVKKHASRFAANHFFVPRIVRKADTSLVQMERSRKCHSRN